jgi:hypothetical protein
MARSPPRAMAFDWPGGPLAATQFPEHRQPGECARLVYLLKARWCSSRSMAYEFLHTIRVELELLISSS